MTKRRFSAALRVPFAADGMAIGLFGGSFNPPHHGHLHVAKTALKRLQLNQLWWMVTPGNPLKDTGKLPPLEHRIAESRALIQDPRILVTGFEAALASRFSANLVAYLVARFPAAQFVWVMGADNLNDFHHWQRWETLADLVPIAVIDRPGDTLARRSSRAARKLMHVRVRESNASILKWTKPPAWLFIHAPRSSLSSTRLRQTCAKAKTF